MCLWMCLILNISDVLMCFRRGRLWRMFRKLLNFRSRFKKWKIKVIMNKENRINKHKLIIIIKKTRKKQKNKWNIYTINTNLNNGYINYTKKLTLH
jgi:hypothetical protein